MTPLVALVFAAVLALASAAAWLLPGLPPAVLAPLMWVGGAGQMGLLWWLHARARRHQED